MPYLLHIPPPVNFQFSQPQRKRLLVVLNKNGLEAEEFLNNTQEHVGYYLGKKKAIDERPVPSTAALKNKLMEIRSLAHRLLHVLENLDPQYELRALNDIIYYEIRDKESSFSTISVERPLSTLVQGIDSAYSDERYNALLEEEKMLKYIKIDDENFWRISLRKLNRRINKLAKILFRKRYLKSIRPRSGRPKKKDETALIAHIISSYQECFGEDPASHRYGKFCDFISYLFMYIFPDAEHISDDYSRLVTKAFNYWDE